MAAWRVGGWVRDWMRWFSRLIQLLLVSTLLVAERLRLGRSTWRTHGHGYVAAAVVLLRASSVPALQSLEKVQVRAVRGPVKGLKGLKLSIMSQSCVRVRAGAYVSLSHVNS